MQLSYDDYMYCEYAYDGCIYAFLCGFDVMLLMYYMRCFLYAFLMDINANEMQNDMNAYDNVMPWIYMYVIVLDFWTYDKFRYA